MGSQELLPLTSQSIQQEFNRTDAIHSQVPVLMIILDLKGVAPRPDSLCRFKLLQGHTIFLAHEAIGQLVAREPPTQFALREAGHLLFEGDTWLQCI